MIRIKNEAIMHRPDSCWLRFKWFVTVDIETGVSEGV